MPGACNNIGFTLDKLGRTNEAISFLREALRLNPNNVGAKQRLHELGVSTHEE